MESKQARSHPLRTCEVCSKTVDPASGVYLRDKWRCGRCWMKLKARL